MIKATKIEKSYNGEKVLRGVSVHIERGEFVSIMGASGSGKSTLLSILGGFLEQDAGEVLFCGRDISTMKENELAALRCTDMGFVFQSYQLIPTLTARDNILLPATIGKRVDSDTEKYMESLVEELELTELLSKYPSQLSGGQCQRVAILRALIYKPKMLILDEPTGALDSRMESKVMELLARTNRELGTTVLQVTHSRRVADFGGRIIYLSDGEICK